jgi:hypothetical protein
MLLGRDISRKKISFQLDAFLSNENVPEMLSSALMTGGSD